MIKSKRVLFVVVVPFFLQSCGTLLTGTKNSIYINTQPEGAVVKLNGLDQGITPVYLNVKKTLGSKIVTIEKKDYHSETFKLGRSFQWVSLINVISVVGWVVDIGTGAVMRYSPKSYFLKLKPEIELEEDRQK